jgi:hypothetical protein
MAGAGVQSFAKFRGQMPCIATTGINSWQTALKLTADCQAPRSGCQEYMRSGQACGNALSNLDANFICNLLLSRFFLFFSRADNFLYLIPLVPCLTEALYIILETSFTDIIIKPYKNHHITPLIKVLYLMTKTRRPWREREWEWKHVCIASSTKKYAHTKPVVSC